MWNGLKNNLSYELPSAQGGETESNWIYFLTFFYSNINNTPECYKLWAAQKALIQFVVLQVRTLATPFDTVSFNYLQISLSRFFPLLNTMSFLVSEITSVILLLTWCSGTCPWCGASLRSVCALRRPNTGKWACTTGFGSLPGEEGGGSVTSHH